jgi:hypothetical protein
MNETQQCSEILNLSVKLWNVCISVVLTWASYESRESTWKFCS